MVRADMVAPRCGVGGIAEDEGAALGGFKRRRIDRRLDQPFDGLPTPNMRRLRRNVGP